MGGFMKTKRLALVIFIAYSTILLCNLDASDKVAEASCNQNNDSEPDSIQIISTYKDTLNAGDVKGCRFLGEYYTKEIINSDDWKTGMAWYSMGVLLDDGASAYLLAKEWSVFLKKYELVDQDRTIIDLYFDAAERGNPEAMVCIYKLIDSNIIKTSIFRNDELLKKALMEPFNYDKKLRDYAINELSRLGVDVDNREASDDSFLSDKKIVNVIYNANGMGMSSSDTVSLEMDDEFVVCLKVLCDFYGVRVLFLDPPEGRCSLKLNDANLNDILENMFLDSLYSFKVFNGYVVVFKNRRNQSRYELTEPNGLEQVLTSPDKTEPDNPDQS